MKAGVRNSIRNNARSVQLNTAPRLQPRKAIINSPSLVFTNICCFFTLYLAFMVTCIVLYKQQDYVWFDIISDETGEWGVGAVTNVTAVNSTSAQCPADFERLNGLFLGTLGKCSRNSGFQTYGRCPRKSGGSYQDGL